MRYADDCNVYVGSQCAGERVMTSLERFLTKRLRLKVNREKSAVGRPWQRKFLGYGMSAHAEPKLKVGRGSVARLKAKLQRVFRWGRGSTLSRTIEKLTPVLRGWASYFRLVELKGELGSLDTWVRRKLRALIWRQWKRPRTRARELHRRGLSRSEAAKYADNGRGPWWNAGARHMSRAIPTRTLQRAGLVSVLQEHERLTRFA